MRALALSAAVVIMYTAHALPRQDLTVRQRESELDNESHVFHHMDRNHRTANKDHDHMYGDSAEGSELYVVKRLPDSGPQRAGWWTMRKERVVDRRFIQDPDYSQGDSRGGSNSTRPASNTMPAQQPPARAEKTGDLAKGQA